MKNKLALIIGVVLGLIAVYGVQRLITSQQQQIKQKYRSVMVASAGARIKAGAELKPNMLAPMELPEQAITDDNIAWNDAMSKVGQVINRTVERGAPLLHSYFQRPAEALQDKLKPGERAITLQVDAVTGVAGNLVPGSHVDILGTFPTAAGTGGKSQQEANQTTLLLANVYVLAVDTRTRETQYAGGPGQRGNTYNTATIAVTPQEANVLVFAQQYGALTLSMRPPSDSTTKPLPPAIDSRNVLTVAAEAQKAREEMVERTAVFTPEPARP